MTIQDLVHRLEEGGGLRYLKHALVLLALLGLAVSYNYRGFRNMANPEAMDAAQVARNLAEGRGFSTLCIRPLSLYLVQKAAAERLGAAPVGDRSDRSQIRGNHPDLANPPGYPVLLAGLMKLMPAMRYQTAGSGKLWNRGGSFWIYAPDFYISLLNQAFFLVAVYLVFLLARRLFDQGVAWTSAAIFLGTDLFWRFSISDLSTMLIILLFLGLVWCLVLLEQKARDNTGGPGLLTGLAVLAGALVAAGALTRYAFGWFILPVLLYLAIFMGKHRVTSCLAVFLTFAALVLPWLIRNYRISHTLFGTAGFALYETTPFFTEYHLQRSLKPDFTQIRFDQLWLKLVSNLRIILLDESPKIGGNWVSAFFLVGLLVGFRNPALGRLRWFVVFCLPVLAVAQALGRTNISEQYQVVNSENLLVIVVPLIIIFGVSLFFTLLDQMNLPMRQLRYVVMGGFCAVMCAPMILTFFSPHVPAIAYPPYYPPVIQQTASWMKPDELMMSDIPWGVAWYGKRQCVWLTLDVSKETRNYRNNLPGQVAPDFQTDFYTIYDYHKTISAVYLTPETMDNRFLSQWVRASEHSWGSFIIDTMTQNALPPYFPLRKMPDHFLPEQMFLTDRERWATNAPTMPPAPK